MQAQDQGHPTFVWRGLLVTVIAVTTLVLVLMPNSGLKRNFEFLQLPAHAQSDSDMDVVGENIPQTGAENTSPTCPQLLNHILSKNEAEGKSMQSLFTEHEEILTKGGLFGYVDRKGRARLEPLGAKSFGRIRGDLDLTQQKHGTLSGENSVFISFPDGTVMTADGDSCKITGFFMGNKRDKTYHPHAREHLVPKFQSQVAAAAPVQCQSAFYTAFYRSHGLQKQCKYECLSPEWLNMMIVVCPSCHYTRCPSQFFNPANGYTYRKDPICCPNYYECRYPDCLSGKVDPRYTTTTSPPLVHAGPNKYKIDMANSGAKCTQYFGAPARLGTTKSVDFFPGPITVMCFRAGNVLDQIKISRSDPKQAQSHLRFLTFGGNGGADKGCFRVYTKCIKTVYVRAGGAVDGMQLMASNGQVSKWFGGAGGKSYEIIGGARCLDSIKVEYGAFIERISFCFNQPWQT